MWNKLVIVLAIAVILAPNWRWIFRANAAGLQHYAQRREGEDEEKG